MSYTTARLHNPTNSIGWIRQREQFSPMRPPKCQNGRCRHHSQVVLLAGNGAYIARVFSLRCIVLVLTLTSERERIHDGEELKHIGAEVLHLCGHVMPSDTLLFLKI